MFKPHGAFFNRDYAVNRFHCRDREGYLPFAFSKTHRLKPGGPFRIKLGAGLSQPSAVYFPQSLPSRVLASHLPDNAQVVWRPV